jgi:hypothetical protein
MISLFLSLLWAGCNNNNPVSSVNNTIQSYNLKVTFSIPQSSYRINDTLKATTTVFNPEDTTVSFIVPVCWPIAWYSVQDKSGNTRLSYSAPDSLGCNSVAMYSILPHQSKQIFLLNVTFPIVDLDRIQNAQGSYILTVKNEFGTFSLKFTVN